MTVEPSSGPGYGATEPDIVAAARAAGLDPDWLNDRSAYQRNFVHGLANPTGLHLQYRLERTPAGTAPDPDPLAGFRVVADWTADPEHMGFPGIAHGGLLMAIVDDVIGRCAALRHHWVVTGRIETRFRAAAPVAAPLRVEGWVTRWQRRAVHGHARVLLPDGTAAVEADGVYLPIPSDLLGHMVEAWPGFAEYAGG